MNLTRLVTGCLLSLGIYLAIFGADLRTAVSADRVLLAESKSKDAAPDKDKVDKEKLKVDESVSGESEKPAEETEKDVSPDRWMLAKRRHAQHIFEGLTDGDFEAVAVSGRRMLVTGVLERWLRENDYVKQSAYQGQLHAFEYANKEVIRHAEARDIDGALKAYVQLSQSCVRCHKLIRDAKQSQASK